MKEIQRGWRFDGNGRNPRTGILNEELVNLTVCFFLKGNPSSSANSVEYL